MGAQGGGRLRVESHVEGGWAVVHVDDDGPGVPAEAAASIFQPFFTTKRGDGGTGLGLSICVSILEQHGGKVRFENRESGCRFTVELPLAGDAESPG
jgi:two-component system sensor histidine kinase HupT/HoxJ